MDLGQTIAILLSAFLGMWYVVGSIFNRRRGTATFDWLQDGLSQFGKLSEARWIGSAGSGARLVIGKPSAPYQRIEVVFLLESREILPLWIVNHLRGKRDEMILKANLRSVPSQELEAAWGNNRDFKKAISGGDNKPFELLPSQDGVEIAIRGTTDNSKVESLANFLSQHQGAVWRVSLQRKAPHLILRANLPTLKEKPAGSFFQEIAQVVG